MHRMRKDLALTSLPILGSRSAEAVDLVEGVLDSKPMHALRFVLERQHLQVDPQPIVRKDLSGYLVRLMFPVTGGPVEDGAIVSVVCLYDRRTERTLYAHPMHAGPGVNPLVRYPDGPMASPQSQADDDGERASRRIIEHKQAIWDRFHQDVSDVGVDEASRRWRERYYWSLQRLYFCAGCTECTWGSPFFDGPDPYLPRAAAVAMPFESTAPLDNPNKAVVAEVLASDEWGVEVAYARRGGFAVSERPRLVSRLDDEFVQVVFPTDALLIQAGSLVGVSFTYHVPSRSVAISHCLAAGPESEIQFLKGGVAFGLPLPQPGAAGDVAKSAYRSWRRSAWSRFWLDELERGLAVASDNWIGAFWNAMASLFDSHDLATKKRSVSRRGTTDVAIAGRAAVVLPAQAIDNIAGRCFAGHAAHREPSELRALGLSTLMVNLGRKCNQACQHCHVDAGPNRTEEMTRETVDFVLSALTRLDIATLDITGGAPEMNPHFRYLARSATKLGCHVVDRCNLTILFEPGYEDLPVFLAEHGIEVCASLPSVDEGTADGQRGTGSFAKSIAGIRKLNELGYGKRNTGLTLNLVWNPAETELGASQDDLEAEYKKALSDRYGIVFDRLFAMNNMPINRFEKYLKRNGRLSAYMTELVRAFNPATTHNMMCRRTISVGYDGSLYDCDFNQMMDVPLREGHPKHIRDLHGDAIRSRLINTAAHCFGCTAGAGSSCNGALADTSSLARGVAAGNGRLIKLSLSEIRS